MWAIPFDQLPPLYQAEEWAGLQTIVIVERTRHLWNETTYEIQFYLSSLPSAEVPPCKCTKMRLKALSNEGYSD